MVAQRPSHEHQADVTDERVEARQRFVVPDREARNSICDKLSEELRPEAGASIRAGLVNCGGKASEVILATHSGITDPKLAFLNRLWLAKAAR